MEHLKFFRVEGIITIRLHGDTEEHIVTYEA